MSCRRKDSLPKAKPRDKDTREPVLFHARPGSFYDEVLSAILLAVVLDLCLGDGALALSSYMKGICYTGLCFSDSHKKFLSQTPRTQHVVCRVGRHGPAV